MKRNVRPALVAIFTAIPVLFVLSALTAQPQQAEPPRPEFSGKVVSVADGDTITVLHNNIQHRIRLEGIDCPESHQDFGTKATKAIADKVFGKEVTIKWKARDKYKRILGEVYLGDRHINLEMVQEGWAWHYVQYSKDPALAKAEKEAKEAKRGLWSMANPIPPWEFRNGKAGALEVAKEQQKGIELAKITVYGTNSGKKYHLSGCRYLAKSMIPMTLADATKRYGPTGACSVCKPPTLEDKAAAKEDPPIADSQPKPEQAMPIPKDKWDCKFFETTYPIKLTAVSFGHIPNPGTGKGNVPVFKLTFEYTEDDKEGKVAKASAEKLKGRIFFFDSENVYLSANEISGFEGLLEGNKGGAFRVLIPMDPDTMAKAKRAQVREVKTK